MIVHESAALMAALDRRLQVERLLALDPLAAIGRPQDRAGGALPSPANGVPLPHGAPATTTATTATQSTAAAAVIAGRLPLGLVIDAHVVDVPQADHVVAEFDTMRIDLAWSDANGATPRPGSDIALRVLAHAPTLVFETVVADPALTTVGDDATSASRPTLVPQPGVPASNRSPDGTGVVRFDVPMLRFVEATAGGGLDTLPATDDAPTTPVEAMHVTADDVVVSRAAAGVDGTPTTAAPALDVERTDRPPGTASMPLVLQGPAWAGQPMELVVRRDRADEAFENAALDHWCGDVTIDLPHLGRVAAHLAFSLQGLRIRVDGDDAAGVDAMTDAAPALATALAGADLRVAALTICRPAPDSAWPDAAADATVAPLRTLEWTDRG